MPFKCLLKKIDKYSTFLHIDSLNPYALLFAVWMSSVFILVFFNPNGYLAGSPFYLKSAKALVYNLFLSAALYYFLTSLPKVLTRVLYIVFACWVLIFTLLSIAHLIFYKQLMGSASVLAILDTNLREVKEFLVSQLSFSRLSIIVFFMIVWGYLTFLIYRHIKLIQIKSRTWTGLVSLVIFCVMLYLANNRQGVAMNNDFLFISNSFMDAWRSRDAYKTLDPGKVELVGATYRGQKSPEMHVLIIGESATPSHMSIYGYIRDTTPLMRDLKAWDSFLAADACSNQPLTQAAVAEIVTGNDYDNISVHQSNLLSVAKEAGYEIYWISNQPGSGDTYGLSDIWAKYAHKSYFLNMRGFADGYDFDKVVLDQLNLVRQEKNQRKLIVVHLMGSHPIYAQRYPISFKKWAESAEVPDNVQRRNDNDFDRDAYNHYDNSIYYSDYIVAKILDIVADADTVTYLSDHGQNVGEYTNVVGHSTVNGPRQGFKVPLIFFINKSSSKETIPDTHVFKKNLSLPYLTRNIKSTLLDLYHISTPTRDNKSLLNARYMPEKRRCDTISEK